MRTTTLYKRNAKNKIVVWSITDNDNNTLSISHGIISCKKIHDVINTTRIKTDEYKSRINAKRKEGYKALEDLYDNSPTLVTDKAFPVRGNEISQADLEHYLDTYLPKYNTTSEGFVLPMLAKTLEDNKPFEKFGIMPGQWKINGLRCIIGVEKIENDLFNPIKLTYTSREGTRWDLSWMDIIIKENISGDLFEMMIEEGVCLDGELYIPGYSVNEINSFVKNSSVSQHYKLQYWCYDITLEGITADKRYNILSKDNSLTNRTIKDKESHFNNKSKFVILPSYNVVNISDAIKNRDLFISYGFEGLIIRNPNAEYAFGKRNSSMFKFKKKEDGLFEIISIKEDKRGLPIYILKNDINDELFECTINLPQDKQRQHLSIKDLLIGKKGLVEYRERSGVKQVPFHAKLIKIYV